MRDDGVTRDGRIPSGDRESGDEPLGVDSPGEATCPGGGYSTVDRPAPQNPRSEDKPLTSRGGGKHVKGETVIPLKQPALRRRQSNASATYIPKAIRFVEIVASDISSVQTILGAACPKPQLPRAVGERGFCPHRNAPVPS